MSLPERGGSAFALPSPTHAHQIDMTSAVRSLRRSISRSPSRFLSRKSDGSTPPSPQSPCRRFRLTPQRIHDPSYSTHAQSAPPAPPFTSGSNTSQSPSFTPLRQSTKLSLRSVKSARTLSPSRQIARTRVSPKSPLRRALNATPDQGNAATQQSNALFFATTGLSLEQENNKLSTSPTAVSPTAVQRQSAEKPSRHSLHLDVSGSSENAFLKALDAKGDPTALNASGLKRNDAMMNLDQPYQGSPVPKRRSMHGASSLDQCVERGIFSCNTTATTGFKIHEDTTREPELISMNRSEPLREFQAAPPTPLLGPPKRSSSLRRSTMLPRIGDKSSWGRRAGQRQLAQMDVNSASTPAKPRAPVAGNQFDVPNGGCFFGSSTPANSNFQSAENRIGPGHHPLSQIQTLSASSSGNSFTEETPNYVPAGPPPNNFNSHPFSRSLPIGAERPNGVHSALGQATPNPGSLLYQGAFGSTGLISKVNRNPEHSEKKLVPPDTPCKPWRRPSDRFNTYPTAGTPISAKKNRGNNRNSFGGISSLTFQPPTDTSRQGQSIFDRRNPHSENRIHDFDGDTSLFDDLNERVSIFGQPPTPTRNVMTPSFSNLSNFSEQSEQGGDEPFDSPSANRKSLGPRDGPPISAVRPTPLRQPNCKYHLKPLVGVFAKMFEVGSTTPAGMPAGMTPSPPTPLELSFPENTGQLPASRPSVLSGLGDSNGAPPATPTTERDFRSSITLFSTPVHDESKYGDDNIEPSLQRLFDDVTKIGDGEFSIVYRVKERNHRLGSHDSLDPVTHQDPTSTPGKDGVFVVKKSKHPYRGAGDRERKLKEARILQALGHAEHVVRYMADWEANDHLYIQTEFCENGSLKDFYSREGFFGRLDDFCIFKILLDLTLVSLPTVSGKGNTNT